MYVELQKKYMYDNFFDCVDSFLKLNLKLFSVCEKESAKPVLSDGSKYGSIVQLSPSRASNTSWWKKRNDRIFRKKTLLMRVPILQWLPKYSTKDFVADLIAGVTIGITVIPQALAYATIGGLPPEVKNAFVVLKSCLIKNEIVNFLSSMACILLTWVVSSM